MQVVALFGEAEKGEYRKAYYLYNIEQLSDHLGNPPPSSLGLFYAIQALLYKCKLIFLKVEEEGFSYSDYYDGLRLLETESLTIPTVSAICLPGVGDARIIDAIVPFCWEHRSIMLTTEADLYDYLTCSSQDNGS